MDNRIKIGFILLTCILLSIILVNSILSFTRSDDCVGISIGPMFASHKDTFFIKKPINYEANGLDGEDYSYLWTDGEGKTSKFAIPDFSFDTPGEKIITLRLNNNCVFQDTIFIKRTHSVSKPVVKEPITEKRKPKRKTKREKRKRPTVYKSPPVSYVNREPRQVQQPIQAPRVLQKPRPTYQPKPAPTPTPKPEPTSEQGLLMNSKKDFTAEFEDVSCVSYSKSSFKVVLQPRKRVRLTGLSIYSDKCGGVEILIQHKNEKESFEQTLVKGKTDILIGFDEDFQKGERYTLQFRSTTSSSCSDDLSDVPLFGQVRDCNVLSQNDLINVIAGKDYIFNVNFKH